MKNKLFVTLLVLSTVIAVYCGTGTAFAAPLRWVKSSGLEGNCAVVSSWIKVEATSADGFDSDEEYIVEFTVTHWAENNSYKLVLSGIDFFNPSKAESLDPDEMWEYRTDGAWSPVSEALNLELIPKVATDARTAYLSVRIKPDFFQKPDFMEYLSYHLELTAELLPIETQ